MFVCFKRSVCLGLTLWLLISGAHGLSYAATNEGETGIVVGFVPNTESLVETSKMAEVIGVYLQETLSAPVKVRTFSDEGRLYNWLSNFREVDFAWLSSEFLDSLPVGELTAVVQSPPEAKRGRRGQLVVHQGVDAGTVQKIGAALLEMGGNAPGRDLLNDVGLKRFVRPPQVQATEWVIGAEKTERKKTSAATLGTVARSETVQEALPASPVTEAAKAVVDQPVAIKKPKPVVVKQLEEQPLAAQGSADSAIPFTVKSQGSRDMVYDEPDPIVVQVTKAQTPPVKSTQVSGQPIPITVKSRGSRGVVDEEVEAFEEQVVKQLEPVVAVSKADEPIPITVKSRGSRDAAVEEVVAVQEPVIKQPEPVVTVSKADPSIPFTVKSQGSRNIVYEEPDPIVVPVPEVQNEPAIAKSVSEQPIPVTVKSRGPRERVESSAEPVNAPGLVEQEGLTEKSDADQNLEEPGASITSAAEPVESDDAGNVTAATKPVEQELVEKPAASILPSEEAVVNVDSGAVVAAAEPEPEELAEPEPVEVHSLAGSRRLTELFGVSEIPVLSGVDSRYISSLSALETVDEAMTSMVDETNLFDSVQASRSFNRDSLAAKERTAQAAAQSGQALGLLKPSVSVRVASGLETSEPSVVADEDTGELISKDTHDRTDASLTVTQVLFDLPRYLDWKRRQVITEAREQNYRISDGDAYLSTVNTYLSLVSSRLQADVTRNFEGQLADLLSYIEKRAAAGAASVSDMARVRARIQSTLSSRLELESAHATAGTEFVRLTNIAPQKVRLPNVEDFGTSLLPGTFESAVEKAFQLNPEVAALATELEAAKIDREAAKGRYYPRLEAEYTDTLSLGAGGSEDSDGQRDRRLMAVFSWDLYSGGKDTQYNLERVARQKELEFRFDDQRRRVVQALSANYTALATTRERLETSYEELDSISTAVDAMSKRMLSGNQSLLDMLDVYDRYFQVRSRLVNLHILEMNTVAQLVRLTYGTPWDTEEQEHSARLVD